MLIIHQNSSLCACYFSTNMIYYHHYTLFLYHVIYYYLYILYYYHYIVYRRSFSIVLFIYLFIIYVLYITYMMRYTRASATVHECTVREIKWRGVRPMVLSYCTYTILYIKQYYNRLAYTPQSNAIYVVHIRIIIWSCARA